MTIEDDNESVSPASDRSSRRWHAYALIVAILILAALLVIRLTLPLLEGSPVVFFVVAGVCWAAIFAATFAVTQSLGRRDRTSD